MTDLVERVAMAIRDVEFPDAVVDGHLRKAARAAIAECLKWRPIAEYDELKTKPRSAVFLFAEVPNRKIPHPAIVKTDRYFGQRTCVGWVPVPTLPKETAP